ncbi:histone H1-like [Sebastes umbrosus]|uniref:histone H1-like n=1 Tax=Sebastes umbrosus TaxID=72105 RepID=UPI00189DC70C|nr:histone H1-like [Sebastes umbrosus]
MAEPEVAPPAAPAAKAPKKKAPTPVKPAGPGAPELILKAVTAYKGRKGISFFALNKELAAQGYDVEHNKHHIKHAVMRLLDSEAIVHTKGVGTVGSFKLNKDAPKGKEVTKKPAATKLTAAKKPAATRKTKAATPKKAKKPAAAKTRPAKKSAKSPKKTAVQKATAPKKAAKKPAKK